MSDPGDLRLAVLSALIGERGPLPCLHVARVRTFKPLGPGQGLNALGSGQDSEIGYRVEASALILRDGAVALALCPLTKVPEPTGFRTHEEACRKRDVLCGVLLRLPWDRTPLGRPLAPDDAAAALRHVQARPGSVKILPRSTEEISAMTFEKHTETPPGA